jgi:hypothetical protein
MQFNELTNVKYNVMNENYNFVKNRDSLEEKYHYLISENIKRERDHNQDVVKKANANNIYSRGRNQDELKKMENEDISDRTPILDILIEKWKYFNRQKKSMIEKYGKNAAALREAFEKIMGYLGVESLDDIPDLLEKIVDQMSNIEIFISNLNIVTFNLEDRKGLIENQIKDLLTRSSQTSNQKTKFIENKKDRIDILKKRINDCKIGIAEKEKFFQDLKEPTDNFLIDLEQTFISDYAPARMHINKEEWYNEENTSKMLAIVQDYLRIIEEVERVESAQNNENIKMNEGISIEQKDNMNSNINKELDKLKHDMKSKIELLNRNNNNLHHNLKERVSNQNFDESIKKFSEDIVKGYYHKEGIKHIVKDDGKKKIK